MRNVSRFLSMLEEEIYGENSPIWEADFTVPASDGTQLGHQTGTSSFLSGCVVESALLMCPCVSIEVISPAAVSGSPALPKGLSGVSAVGNVESGGAEPHTGQCSASLILNWE